MKQNFSLSKIKLKTTKTTTTTTTTTKKTKTTTLKTAKQHHPFRTKNLKAKVRRNKANARERNRMHQLNAAFDCLRKHIPIVQQQQQQLQQEQQQYQQQQQQQLQQHQCQQNSSTNLSEQFFPTENDAQTKLSKIETLRLAKNYIISLNKVLHENQPIPINDFFKILTRQLSQTTSNLVRAKLYLDNELKSNLITMPVAPTMSSSPTSSITAIRQIDDVDLQTTINDYNNNKNELINNNQHYQRFHHQCYNSTSTTTDTSLMNSELNTINNNNEKNNLINNYNQIDWNENVCQIHYCDCQRRHQRQQLHEIDYNSESDDYLKFNYN